MAAWRKGEVDADRTSPGEERGNGTGKFIIPHGTVEFCEARPTDLADEPKESLYGRSA